MTVPKEPAKLPVRQLAILSICRFAEPVALQSVFPYLPEMIESFNIPENEVGKWVGIVAAVFSLTQCVTGILWGRLADWGGRKPAILSGLLVTMIASLVFGFSHTLAQAIIARSIAGGCSGTVGVIRTTVAEMVPQRELQPRAFSVMPLVWSIGSIVGPMFGGALANPVQNYPGIFGGSSLLKEFPYALPNIVASILFIVGLAAGLLFLKETLETRKNQRDYGLVLGELIMRPCSRKRKSPRWLRGENLSSTKKTSSQAVAPPSFRDVFSPQSNLNLLAYSILALHSIAYDQLVPVFLHLNPQDRVSNPDVKLPFKFSGGFGVGSRRIGVIFTAYSIVVMFVQFLCFPPIARRYGVLKCLKVCTLTFPIAYFLTPFTVLFKEPVTQQVAIFIVMLIKASGIVFAFPCVTIMLTNSARSLRLLGTLNGVSTSLSAIGRAAGPSLAGGLFTLGDDIGYMILPWWVLGLFGIAGHVCTYWLVELEGFGADSEGSDEGESHEAQTIATADEDTENQDLVAGLPANDSAVIDDRDDDDFAVEDGPLLAQDRERAARSKRRGSKLTSTSHERTMSSPLGFREPVGPGGRRLSNGLGQSNNGLGTGGGSFH